MKSLKIALDKYNTVCDMRKDLGQDKPGSSKEKVLAIRRRVQNEETLQLCVSVELGGAASSF